MEASTPPSPPSSASPASGSGRPGGAWWAGALVVAIALGVGGYFIGDSHGKDNEKDKYASGSTAYKAIYSSGFDAGQRRGQAAGTKAGAKAGQAQGAAAGQKVGFQKGEAAGAASGAKEGADQALGGFSSWDTGAPYIVQSGQGPSADVPITLTKRIQMEANTDYALCQASTTTVCTSDEQSP